MKKIKYVVSMLLVGGVVYSFATAPAQARPTGGDPQGFIFALQYGAHVPTGK